MNRLIFGALVGLSAMAMPHDATAHSEQLPDSTAKATGMRNRLSIGGYGEAVMTRNFYSDNYLRYSTPDAYKGQSHGRFDLPHVVIFLGYDFGRDGVWGRKSNLNTAAQRVP